MNDHVHPAVAIPLNMFAARQTLAIVERSESRAIVDCTTATGERTRYLVLRSPGPKPLWVARYVVPGDATLATAKPGRMADDMPSWAVVQFAERAGL